MKLLSLSIDAPTILEMFKGGYHSYSVIANAVPDDANVHSAWYDFETRCFRIAYHTESGIWTREGELVTQRPRPMLILNALPPAEDDL